MKAEEDLYRRIEPYILPFEQFPQPQKETLAVVQPKLAPAPGGELPSAKAEAAPPAALAAAQVTPRAAVITPPKVEPISPAPEAVVPSSPGIVSQKKDKMIEEPLPIPLTTLADANVRIAPSIQSKVMTVLKKGEKAEKIGESGIWMKVKLSSGEVAWIHRDFVREMKPGERIPAVPTSPAKEPFPRPSPPDTKASPVAAERPSAPVAAKKGEAGKKEAAERSKSILATKAVEKMRAEPSATSKVVLVLKKGREVEKIEESGGYSKVRLSWGDSGWVLTRSLERVR